MRAVVQRVANATLTGENIAARSIGHGLLVLIGITHDDTMKDAEYILGKCLELRVFPDIEGKMNRSVVEAGGALMLVSQFTLYGDCRRGRRPSYSDAMPPESARQLYDAMVVHARCVTSIPIETGLFQSTMDISLVNTGPVTLLLDSKKRF